MHKDKEVKKNVKDIFLSMCNHTIITVGSFGWWSAWLANGTTVYFKDVAKQKRLKRHHL
jgi:galactoside 2-L-fucosyltransferase 1/2